MASQLSRAIRDRYCPYWHAEAVAKVARVNDDVNHAYGMAFDSANSLTRDINAFFHQPEGSDQMPPSPSSAAMMPPSLGDNFTGSSHFHQRNHNASDQDEVGEILQYVNQAASRMSDEDCTRLWQGLQSMFAQAAAEDENGGLRLPNGTGVQAQSFFEPHQGMTGTFSEKDRLTSPRATADARPRTARDRRRMADDRQMMAQDSISEADRYASFSSRFPDAVKIEIWGGR